MSIETQRKKTFQMIRMEPDMSVESDESAVKHAVEQALTAGVKDFVFSVSAGSVSDRAIIARLLLWCGDIVRCRNGRMLLFERNAGEKCAFGALCDSLQIPVYRGRAAAARENPAVPRAM